jgi:hypothetical protein
VCFARRPSPCFGNVIIALDALPQTEKSFAARRAKLSACLRLHWPAHLTDASCESRWAELFPGSMRGSALTAERGRLRRRTRGRGTGRGNQWLRLGHRM